MWSSLILASAGVSSLEEPDQLIIDFCASPYDNLISLSYSMPAFSVNCEFIWTSILKFWRSLWWIFYERKHIQIDDSFNGLSGTL